MNSLCFSHFGDFFYYSFNYDREFGGTICWVDCCFFFFRNPVLFLRPCPKRLVGTNNHVPHSHQVVCVTRGVWPSAHHTRGGSAGWLCLAAGAGNFLFQFIYSDSPHTQPQVPDLDSGVSGSTESVAVGA